MNDLKQGQMGPSGHNDGSTKVSCDCELFLQSGS